MNLSLFTPCTKIDQPNPFEERFPISDFENEYLLKANLSESRHAHMRFNYVVTKMTDILLGIVEDCLSLIDQGHKRYIEVLAKKMGLDKNGVPVKNYEFINISYDKVQNRLVKRKGSIKSVSDTNMPIVLVYYTDEMLRYKDGTKKETEVVHAPQSVAWINNIDRKMKLIRVNVNLSQLVHKCLQGVYPSPRSRIASIRSFIESTLNHEFHHVREIHAGKEDPTLKDSFLENDLVSICSDADPYLQYTINLFLESERRARLSATYHFIKNLSEYELDNLSNLRRGFRKIDTSTIETILEKMGQRCPYVDEHGNVQYDASHDPSMYAAMVKGYNHLYKMCRDEKLNQGIVTFLQVNARYKVFGRYGINKNDDRSIKKIEADGDKELYLNAAEGFMADLKILLEDYHLKLLKVIYHALTEKSEYLDERLKFGGHTDYLLETKILTGYLYADLEKRKMLGTPMIEIEE